MAVPSLRLSLLMAVVGRYQQQNLTSLERVFTSAEKKKNKNKNVGFASCIIAITNDLEMRRTSFRILCVDDAEIFW